MVVKTPTAVANNLEILPHIHGGATVNLDFFMFSFSHVLFFTRTPIHVYFFLPTLFPLS
jgi:hypothetical protein